MLLRPAFCTGLLTRTTHLHKDLARCTVAFGEQHARCRRLPAAMADADGVNRWEQMWQRGIVPGDFFDRECASPALVDLLSRSGVKDGRSAFVPGCGRGYDVVELAASGLFGSVIGLDYAPTGVAAAKEFVASKPGTERASLVCEDFFKYKGVDGGFSFIYDYTFLCALPVGRRPEWARKMAELIAPDGVLVTLMFPLDKPLSDGGPPYGVSLAIYDELLGDVGLEVVDGPHILPDALAHHDRGAGQSGIAHWKLKARSSDS
jgi:methyl halide transferase